MKRKVNLKKLYLRSVKAEFIGYDDKSAAYILQEFESKKVIRARNVIFKASEIQSLLAKETINAENPNLVSPNMDFEDDRSDDENTKIPVQDKVGEIVQRHLSFKISQKPRETPRKKKSHYPEKAETIVHRKDMDYPTLST